MNDITFKVWVKAQLLKTSTKEKLFSMKNTFLEEDGDGGANGLVIGIIMLVIVLGLVLIFREQLWKWITSLFNAADDQIDQIVNNSGGGNVVP